MDLESIVLSGVYPTLVGEDADYIDAAMVKTSIRVVPEHDEGILLDGASRGIRGVIKGFNIRRSSLARPPVKGEMIIHKSITYCVDDEPEDVGDQEWLVRVVT
mgnify:CR=1 FL=1